MAIVFFAVLLNLYAYTYHEFAGLRSTIRRYVIHNSTANFSYSALNLATLNQQFVEYRFVLVDTIYKLCSVMLSNAFSFKVR